MDSPRAFSMRKWVSEMASPGLLPAVFIIKLLAKPLRASFPLVQGGGHNINAVGVASPMYKMVHASTEW
jgi:hypothetical protein